MGLEAIAMKNGNIKKALVALAALVVVLAVLVAGLSKTLQIREEQRRHLGSKADLIEAGVEILNNASFEKGLLGPGWEETRGEGFLTMGADAAFLRPELKRRGLSRENVRNFGGYAVRVDSAGRVVFFGLEKPE